MATTPSNDPSTYPAGTTPTGGEQVLANQSGSLVSLTTTQLTQLSYNSLALWKTYDTVAQMKADANGTYARVKWRGYNYVGDGGGGEGKYVTGNYTADEGTVFATTAGGYVLRDIPHGDVKTPWFGMTYPSGAVDTVTNPTSAFGDYNPSKDFSPALQAASNFAAASGRALHIVGRQGSYRLGSSVTLKGVRRIYGDGPTLDGMFATSLNWAPTAVMDKAAGLILTDTDQVLEKIQVVMLSDPNWPSNVTPSTLISGGQLTVPSGFVWHTGVLPYSAFASGLVGIWIKTRAVLRDVTTKYGKFGVMCDAYVGHITFDNCSLQGGCAGRFWAQNGQDNYIVGGESNGNFCSELMAEGGFTGTVIRYHQFHTPIGWYQCNYANTGSYNGIGIQGMQLAVEALSEAWIFMPVTSGGWVDVTGGGDFYAYPASGSAYELGNNLPDGLFVNSKRNMYSCGRFGSLLQFRANASIQKEIVPSGGTGTFSVCFGGFPNYESGSDFSVFSRGNVDFSQITNNNFYQTNVAWKRNLNVMADRSDPAVKTSVSRLGNLALNTNAYSSSMGLGVSGNCLISNGGGWSIANDNSSYPGSIKMDRYQNWLAAGIALVIPEHVARMVGPNPLIIEVTSTGSASKPAGLKIYIEIFANNVADGQQGLYSSVCTAGRCTWIVASSANANEYINDNIGVVNDLTFQSTFITGKVLPSGTLVKSISLKGGTVGDKFYVIAPMVNFGALSEYNPHAHPAALDPMYLTAGLRQAARTFVTTTASGAATTTATIADFLIAVDATAAAGTVMLPAAPFEGEVHVIKKADATANAVTVNGNGVSIDGAATYVLPGNARGSVRLQYVGAAGTPRWYVV